MAWMAAVLAALAAGCGRREAAPAPTEAPAAAAAELEKAAKAVEKNAPQAAEGLAAMMKAVAGAQQQGVAAGTVDYKELKALLPETIGDFKRTGASGEKSGAMGMAVAHAEGTYEAKDANLRVKITDMGGMGGLGAIAQAGWAMTEVDREGDDGYERTVKVKGFKALEKYDTKSKRGEMNILVGSRFQVEVDGSDVTPEQVKAAVEALDLQKLSTLKPKPAAP
jgi:hypothetical protein